MSTTRTRKSVRLVVQLLVSVALIGLLGWLFQRYGVAMQNIDASKQLVLFDI